MRASKASTRTSAWEGARRDRKEEQAKRVCGGSPRMNREFLIEDGMV